MATATDQAKAMSKSVPPMFTPLKLRDMTLTNRVAMSPMCMYSATDGLVSDFHVVHLGSRAVGGAAMVMTEMTGVSPEGRISLGCAGIWSDAHVAPWQRVVDFVHGQTPAKIALQLGHAGRKGAQRLPWEGRDEPLGPGEAWTLMAPSARLPNARLRAISTVSPFQLGTWWTWPAIRAGTSAGPAPSVMCW